MKPLRLTVRLHNNRLVKLREELGMRQSDAARAMGMAPSIYNALETMRESPLGKYGEWRPTALKVAEFHGMSPEWLFPDAVKSVVKNTTFRELDSEVVDRLLGNQPRQLAQVEQVFLSEMTTALNNGIDSVLPDREALVLKLRFGLNGEEEHDLEHIGMALGLSRERVRQIEARALKKLRDEVPSLVEATPFSVPPTNLPEKS